MHKKGSTSVQNYRESLHGDVRKRYDEKTACIKADPYAVPAMEFDNDRSKWPDLGYVDVVNFLLFQKSSYTKDQLRNYKSLEAYKLFQDGWVKELLHKDISGVHLFRAKVHHSMRIREKPLEPWVLVSSEGTVEAAHCTCMAGLGECCSHAAAVLFALETATRLRGESTVTDTSAYWKFPSAACFDQPFVKIRDMNFQSAAKKRKLSMTYENLHQPDITVLKNNVSSPTKLEEQEFFNRLSEVMPNACILSLTDNFCKNFEPKSVSKNWPIDLGSLYDSALVDRDYDDILSHCDTINLKITNEQVKLVENETRQQSDSAHWHKVRAGRITASNFHAATHTDTSKPSKTVVQAICKSTIKPFSTKATEWGKKKEVAGRNSYCDIMKVKHTNFQCRESGLYLSTNYPQMGASPDGMVSCDCCGTGCIEIKCPYTQKDSDTNIKWIIKNSDGTKGLDRKHAYYSQVQAQIHVTESSYCDFIVWTPRTITIERIQADHEFWLHYSELAQRFHRLCVMPELCCNYFSTRSVLKVLSNSVNTDTNSTSEVKFCICGGQDDGRKMIECENQNCKYVWFHTACIKMKRIPKGKWICRYCKNGNK